MHSPSERTLGDGIDNSLLNLTETTTNKKIKMKLNTSQIPITFKPIEPKCQMFPLKPVYVTKDRKTPKYLTRKPKEPKFVPYEPYKGAVEPIIAPKPPIKPQKTSKNNVEIQELVAQMREFRNLELNKATEEAVKNDEPLICRKQWEQEKIAYENDIKNLRESNAHLEHQVKFQAQVNSELKTLLVAAVGEDLESRVQHLTEDKLQLARALLNSANHLTSHQERTEWLSGQCEVWRSKFLASSLMVEELARWKSALSSRINELQETVKSLLDERYRVQKNSIQTCCYLQEIKRKICSNEAKASPSSNILDLSGLNCQLAKEVSQLVDIDKRQWEVLLESYMKLSQHTLTEKHAMKLLQNPVIVSSKQDAICSALMGTALSLSGEQVYLKNPAGCCSHCTGEVMNI